MKVYEPDMAFRGARMYLHSTDLYEEILAGCRWAGLGAVDGPLTLKIRRKLTFQPELCFLATNEEGDASGAGADFVVTAEGRSVSGLVRETTRPVARRKDYDERPIWEGAETTGSTITVRTASGATPIEVVTALGVLQHRILYPPKEGYRWMLARIDLARPLRRGDAPYIAITLRRHVGQRMTRSTLASAGVALGTMDFLLASS